MTPDEFLDYTGSTKYYAGKDKGKARLNRARKMYGAYLEAFYERSLHKLAYIARLAGSGDWKGVRQACCDRDNGLTEAVLVDEFYADWLNAKSALSSKE